MNRKLFIKNSSLSFLGLVSLPISNIVAKENHTFKNTLSLGSMAKEGNLVQIKGLFLDASSKKIVSAKLKIQKSVNEIIVKDSFESSENFVLQNNLGEKFFEKIDFKIEAPGYKTFEGSFLINKVGVNIGSAFWKYNSNYDAELKPNNHTVENGILKADFDFHLVKL